MSISNFHRIFFAITGCQAKEYLIKHRMSQASSELKTGQVRVTDLAMKYSYDSVDAFSRIFKKITGYTPSTCAHELYQYKFERLNVMEKYFMEGDEGQMEKYPEIKVLKKLPRLRVAYYCFYGKCPEDGAFAVMKRWVLQNKLDYDKKAYRIFGYNAPDSDASAEEYGYEVCVTIPEDMEVKDGEVKTKVIEGGFYAVMSIERKDNLGEEIMKGWERFSMWLNDSKYVYGDAQCLEEHLGFDDKFEHIGGVDLYMPVKEKRAALDIEATEETLEPFTAATYTAVGHGAEHAAKKYLFGWAKKQGIDLSEERVRVFATYNFERIGKPDYCYKLFIKIPENITSTDEKVNIEKVLGGSYLKKQPFMEEYLIQGPVINGETDVIQYMPVRIE